MDEPEIESLSFEAALAQLEGIVRSLETGTAPLDESIELYQRGDRLKRHCERGSRRRQARSDRPDLARRRWQARRDHQFRCWLSEAWAVRTSTPPAARVSSAVDTLLDIICPTRATAATTCSRRCATRDRRRQAPRPLLTLPPPAVRDGRGTAHLRVGAAIEAIHVLFADPRRSSVHGRRRHPPRQATATRRSTTPPRPRRRLLPRPRLRILSDGRHPEDPFVRAELVLEMARARTPRHGGGQMLDLVAEGETLDLGAISGCSIEDRALIE